MISFCFSLLVATMKVIDRPIASDWRMLRILPIVQSRQQQKGRVVYAAWQNKYAGMVFPTTVW